MRILLLSHLFPKASDHRHGVFVLRQAEQLRRLGHEIEVISPVPFIPQWLTRIPRWRRYKNQAALFNIENFQIYRPAYFRPPGGWFIGYEGNSMWKGIRGTVQKLAKSNPFDIVFAQDFRADVSAGIAAGKELGIPCVGMAIGSDLNESVYVSARSWRVITNSIHACDGIICTSQALALRVDNLTRGQRNAECIRRGTDLKSFTPVNVEQKRLLRRQVGWPDNSIIFLYSGYLQAEKGLFELISAFEQIASRNSDACLVILGSGVEESSLKMKAKQSSFTNRIFFHGFIDHSEIHRYIQAADVAVMPSYAEGMPNAVVESIACGLPVLGTRIGGIPEAAPEERVSLLVPPKNVDKLVKAALRFCASSKLRIEMGHMARKHAELQFDSEKNSRSLSEFLEKIRIRNPQANRPPVHSSVQVVDITSNSFDYMRKLTESLKSDPKVVCRASTFLPDPSWYHDVSLREDLMIWTRELGKRFPYLMNNQLTRKTIRSLGYLTSWVQIILDGLRENTRLVHMQWCMLPLFDIFMFRLLRVLGIQIVYTVHNALPHNSNRKFIVWMYRQLYLNADALVVLSEQIALEIEEKVISGIGHKVHVIHHGILPPKTPIPSRSIARQSLSLDEEDEMVLFMGRIDKYKGISDLIDAFSIALKSRPQLKLFIAGSPAEPFGHYEAQIRNHKIEKYVYAYPKYVSIEFMLTLYAATDVSILPHRQASQSGSGLESLAMGKPIIATNTGGLPDLIDNGRSGYIVPVKDPAAIAHAIISFFCQSRENQGLMAKASRQLGLERYGWGPIADKHVDLYKSLVQI